MTAPGRFALAHQNEIAVGDPRQAGRRSELQVEGRGGEQAHAGQDDAQATCLPPNDSGSSKPPRPACRSAAAMRRVQDEVSCL